MSSSTNPPATLEMSSSRLVPLFEVVEDCAGEDVGDKTLDVNTLKFMRFDKQDGHNSLVFISPNGTQFWCPDVKTEDKPLVGTVFENWDDAQSSYKKYAHLSGFFTRISTSKNVAGFYTLRYILCNRAGKPQNQVFDTMDPSSMCNVRNRSFACTDCPAFLRMKAVERTSRLVVYKFMELHNHPLVSGANMDLLKKGKDLSYDDIQFIHRMSLTKVGPNVAHRVHAVLNGGHHNLRGTRSTYKNVSRDIRVFIGDRDAQMVINTLEERRKNLPNFSFQYSEVGGELRSVFWADDVMKTNYIAFGDVLAFDATYQTNTYNMIFVPFTGVDLHKKCVTFAAGLIYNETGESYKWFLQCFIDTHVKQPKLILTDQDLGMKQGVDSVFKESKHRLCMWHIMNKLPVKV